MLNLNRDRRWNFLALAVVFSLVFSLIPMDFAEAVTFGGGGTGGFSGGDSGNFFGGSSNWQYMNPSFNTIYSSEEIGNYWPIFNQLENDQCEAASDFVIGIPPGGCTPSVVRSDLLAEQNVPVFCKLDALQINPLVKVSSIKSVSFSGDYPEGVAGISFHPARAAVNSYNTLLGSPVLNNIGYVVIILDRTQREEDILERIKGNLTATIHYDADEAYGVGRGEYYLPVLSDREWSQRYNDYSFWSGKGYVRAVSIGEEGARIRLYTDENNEFRELNLREGETSQNLYFPGYYCRAGLKVKLNKIDAVADEARIRVDGTDIWVRDGSRFLNGKCRVSELNVLGDGTGSLEIRCSSGTANLILSRYGGDFNIGEQNKKLEIGEKVGYGKLDGEEVFAEWYVGYVGKVPENVKEIAGKDYTILITSAGEPSQDELSELAKHVATVAAGDEITAKRFKDTVGSYKTFSLLNKPKFKVLVEEGSANLRGEDGPDVSVEFNSLAENTEEKTYGSLTEEYYDGSVAKTLDLVDGAYAHEEKANGEKYGEEALYNQIVLAKEMGKQKSQSELIQKYLQIYPNSVSADVLRDDLKRLQFFDYDKAFASVFADNGYHTISVEQFKSVGKDEKKFRLYVGARNEILNEGDVMELGTGRYVVVDEIEQDRVKVTYHYKEDGDEEEDSFTLKEDEPRVVGDRQFVARNLDVKAAAYVSLIPEVEHTKTEANFTFNIGIEKRAIELSPEKTKERIKNLNETIAKWEELNEKFANLIKAWKGACFATSSLLMVKTAMEGFTGKSMARSQVMKMFRDRCENEEQFRGMTKTQCYNELAPEIDAAVNGLTEAYNNVNERIDPVLSQYKNGEGILGLDSSVSEPSKYRDALKENVGKSTEVKFENAEGEEVSYTIDDATTIEQIRAYMLYEEAEKTGNEVVIGSAKEELNNKWNAVWLVREAEKARKEVADQYGGLDVDFNSGEVGMQKRIYGIKTATERVKQNGLDIAKGTKYKGFTHNGQKYLYTFAGTSTSLAPDKLFRWEGNNFVKVGKDDKITIDSKKVNTIENIQVSYQFESGGSCSGNEWKREDASVRYYEFGQNSGWPAVVPFDLRNGWYAKVPNSAGTILEGQQGYTAAGDVSYFTICNIGQNRKMENGAGDDLCQSVNSNNYDSVTQFIPCPEMGASDVRNLVERARQAIRQAQSQFGSRQVSILDQGAINVGNPMSNTGDYECQDFMSPEDCKMLFNVCDPVICPPSRCNLGGKYPVSDVVQTGIIGSLVLCLPNAKEGVAVPVCLTGIQAGVDTLVSIMKSSRQCLQENLESGKYVGICDQITSVYLCEFFWRQFAPLMDIIIPRFIEYVYSGGQQSVRGGGEYATVMHAWDNLEKSVSYFKDNYAQNSFRAFQARSVEEAGGEVCKMFVGTSFPTSADMLDSLLAPESPTQFYAWFSEATFSEATVPATSQYKVFYHIYAGNDKGTYYRVYLKDPPASSYYRTSATVPVKTGYIPKGEQATESIDFTAPQGYKQLCVQIDGDERCGFKQVSTDFGVEYLRKKYVEEQATQTDITSEKECISGTRSAGALLNPNVQAGVEEAINPDVSLRGIVRVCATQNPNLIETAEVVGQQGDGAEVGEGRLTMYGRWVDVGHCGDENIRCWLDTQSVEKDLKDVAVIENKSISVLDEVKEDYLGSTKLNYEDAQKELNDLDKKVTDLKMSLKSKNTASEIEGVIGEIVERLEKIAGVGEFVGGGTNADRAWALQLRSRVYRIVVRHLKEEGEEKVSYNSGEISENVGAIVKKHSEGFDGDVDYNSLEEMDSGDEEDKEEDEVVVPTLEGGTPFSEAVFISDLEPGNEVRRESDEKSFEVVEGRILDDGIYVIALKEKVSWLGFFGKPEITSIRGNGADTLESKGYDLIE